MLHKTLLVTNEVTGCQEAAHQYCSRSLLLDAGWHAR